MEENQDHIQDITITKIPLNGDFDNSDNSAAVLVEGFLPSDEKRTAYHKNLKELKPFLSQGEVKVHGTHKERRLTGFFSLEDCPMEYSGRSLKPQKPPHDSEILILFKVFNSQEGRDLIEELIPELEGIIPHFNAVFVNWYRPLSELDDIKKPDGLGYHADDERSHKSKVILSVTYCEKNGERLFRLRRKNETSGYAWQSELPDGSAFFMLPGCQNAYKHCVCNRKTRLDKTLITGGRLNFTFRSLTVSDE